MARDFRSPCRNIGLSPVAVVVTSLFLHFVVGTGRSDFGNASDSFALGSRKAVEAPSFLKFSFGGEPALERDERFHESRSPTVQLRLSRRPSGA